MTPAGPARAGRVGGKDPGPGWCGRRRSVSNTKPSHGPAAAPCGGGRGGALSLPTNMFKGTGDGLGRRALRTGRRRLARQRARGIVTEGPRRRSAAREGASAPNRARRRGRRAPPPTVPPEIRPSRSRKQQPPADSASRSCGRRPQSGDVEIIGSFEGHLSGGTRALTVG